MEKIWLKNYPPGVPAEIDVNEFRSLADLFEQSCRRFAPAGRLRQYGEVHQLR